METPNLERVFVEEAMGLVDDGLQNLEENWINREAKACNNCKGHKFDPEDFTICIACDGTGVDMYIEYGVEDGKFVSRVIQNGMEPLRELCKELREQEKALAVSQRAKKSITAAFLLPESARMELSILEPDFEKWMADGDNKKAAKLVRKHYPDLMTTNYLF